MPALNVRHRRNIARIVISHYTGIPAIAVDQYASYEFRSAELGDIVMELAVKLRRDVITHPRFRISDLMALASRP